MPDIDPRTLRRAGASMYAVSLGTVALCVMLWIRAKAIGEDERANAERRALFVGLWPGMFWLLGDALWRRAGDAGRHPAFRVLRGRR